jgi:hypothetical protein
VTESEVAAPPPGLDGWNILIADDNALVRELFTAYLTEQGACCTTAVDGLEAIDRCSRGNFDALVLDLSMPWADGYEVVRRLRASGGRGVRIVGVSAHAAGAEREKALAACMEAFLVKPVVLAELAAAVAGRAVARSAARWPGDTALQAKLEQQFRAELPQLLAELAAARAAEDFERISLRAHYLKNSADVLEHRALQVACIGLEAAATAGDPVACAAAWERLQGAAQSALR